MESKCIQFGEVTIKIISNSEQLTVAEFIIPSNLPHNIKNREAGGVILSVWTPSRTDLIDKITIK